MTDGVSLEEIQGTVKALRYAVWHATSAELVAAGADPADMPPCPVADEELAALAAPLAALVTAARQAIAEQIGITGLAEQAAFARGQLQAELDAHELNAAFAEIEADEEPLS